MRYFALAIMLATVFDLVLALVLPVQLVVVLSLSPMLSKPPAGFTSLDAPCGVEAPQYTSVNASSSRECCRSINRCPGPHEAFCESWP